MISKLIATFFGVGFIKPSGSICSLVSILVIFPIMTRLSLIGAGVIIVLIWIMGYFAIRAYTKNMKDKDPGEVVIDETLGMYVTIFGTMFLLPEMNLKVMLVSSFVMFRFFDIVKPIGIGYIDRKIKGPFGTLLDDVVAGIYSIVVIYVVYYIL